MDNMDYENMSSSELRRKARADLERNALTAEPDKIQLKDIMLFVLVGLAAVVSMTDLSLSWRSVRDFTALTVFLYIITTLVFQNRYEKGKNRGRTDDTYKETLTNYRKARDEIFEKNLAGEVPNFCQEYKMSELREYRESLLIDANISYDEYAEKYIFKSDKDILQLKLPWRIKKILLKANNAKSIKLDPGAILNESGETSRKKLLGMNGRQREKIDKRFNAISRIIITLFTGLVAINIIMDFSLLTIVQWCVRMIPIFSAIIMGDDSGYCDIVITETNFKQSQIAVIKLFYEKTIKKIEKEKEQS